MGPGVVTVWNKFRIFPLRRAVVTFLAAIVGVAPISAGSGMAQAAGFSGPGFTSPITSGSGQAGAQSAAASTNTMASNLSKLTSVLSMAAGGLFIAKGVEQMKCCAGGCTGNGAASQKEKDDIDKKSKSDAKKIMRSFDYGKLRFPEEAGNCLPHPPGRGVFLLFDFLAPLHASASLGCIDAMLSMATGGLMLLQGFLGMQAANQASQNAENSNANMGNMNSNSLNSATAPTPETNGTIGSSSIGSSGRSSIQVQIDPALLRTGRANDIMAQLENKFGIPRDQFANSVANGEDPRKLFGSAPSNSLSNDDMNKATAAANKMSASEKANAMAGTAFAAAQAELAGKIGAGGDSQFAMNNAAGRVPSASSGRKTDSELESILDTPAASDDPKVSPEVQSALAAKALEDRKNGITELSIFQVVHDKYRQVSKIIFGYDPDRLPKGVTNADGM